VNAASQILIAITTLLLQITLNESALFGNGLITGTVLSVLISGLFLIFIYRRDYGGVLQSLCRSKRSWCEVIASLKRYRSFPMYSLPYSILSNLHMQITMLAVGVWYGLSTLGQFNLAQRTLYVPISFANTALSQILLPKLPNILTQKEIMQRLITAILRIVGYCACFPLALVAVWGQDIYALVLGEPWRMTGLYAAAQIPAIFAMTITLWMERVFDALNKQRLHLFLSCGLNLFTLLLFLAAHLIYGDSLTTIFAWSIGMLIYAVVWLNVAFYLSRFSAAKLMGLLTELILMCFFTTITLAISNLWVETTTGKFTVAAVVGLTFLGIMSLRLKNDFKILWHS